MIATIPKYRLFIATNFWTLFWAGFLLFWDLSTATFACSIMVCPVWFLISVIRNYIAWTDTRLFLFRTITPVLVLGISLANTHIQWKIADANGERIVTACQSYYADNSRYPKTLDELVPRYLPAIPRATYSIIGDFHYYNSRESDSLNGPTPILWWDKFGPLCKIYSFDSRGWHHLD